MAYASAASPFSAVKGRNIFKKTSPTSPSFASSQDANAPTKSTDLQSSFASGSSVPSLTRSKSPAHRSGSGSQSRSSISPTRRASPASLNAFSSYATGGVHGFHVPKRVRAVSPGNLPLRSVLDPNPVSDVLNSGAEDSGADDDDEGEGEESKPVSFGEKLRAEGDDESRDSDSEQTKLVLTEQESECILSPVPVMIDFRVAQLRPGKRTRKLYTKFVGNFSRSVPKINGKSVGRER
jgi:Ran-binding protein 3